MKKYFPTIVAVIALLLVIMGQAKAQHLGTIETSGMLFKDKLEIHAFDDPTIKGVTCFVTLPKRSMSIEDQTDTSIACRKVGKIDGNLVSQKQIFKRSKSWFLKSMYVDRIWDAKRKSLVYVSYTKKMSGDNANNSVSVVTLN